MHSDDFVKAVTVIAQLRYAIFRFAATGFALIERTRLLINEDEECTLHNLQSGFDVSHFTSVLDEMEEALRALHKVEATREFASVQTKTFRAMRNSLVEFLSPVEWEGSARKWWEEFEKENQHRLPLIHRLAQELQRRKATITEFFLAYVYSNTDNIQANLHYLDYTRLKKQDDDKKHKGDDSSS